MGDHASVHDIVESAAVRTVFQPIVDLDAGAVVAYEALSRGPEGPLHRPDALFAAAEEHDLLGQLDAVCRTAALRNAASLDWPRGVPLFVNVEPKVLDVEPLDELISLARSAPRGLRVVLEITERAIGARPAELLSCVRKLRQAGWRIALDDVGADDMSLAFMPLLKPDVVKLDLELVQGRPGPAVARIMNAVNAYAQRSGAVLLAEGIEDENHLQIARALGAQLGQGWLFGRPAPSLHASLPAQPMTWDAQPAATDAADSPFGCLPADTRLRRSTKPLLVEFSKHLEQEALDRGKTCIVVSTFQYAHHFTPRTAERYESLAARLGFVAAIGEGLSAEPAPGVRGADLDDDDAVRDEWDIVVLAPHFAAALLARDLGDTGPDRERQFEFALTYDRSVVSRAAEALLHRVAPVESSTAGAAARASASHRAGGAPAPGSLPEVLGVGLRPGDPAHLLRRALGATTNGVTIADVTRPDHPLVFVNAAFERLSGYDAAEVVGANCRSLQGPGTDRATVARIRAAIAEGRECRETILNYRKDVAEPWWNEIYLAPIRDDQGRVTQYIGVQNDVTARVTAELELERERARSREYLAELEKLALHDPLTGLANRRRLPEVLEEHLRLARSKLSATALLYLDVDSFKAVNDDFGHLAGDAVLRRIGERLQRFRGCLKARIGGDEFLVVLEGLDLRDARAEAQRAADDLELLLREDLDDHRVTVSIGVSTFPDDGHDFDALLNAADHRMYQRKTTPRPVVAAP